MLPWLVSSRTFKFGFMFRFVATRTEAVVNFALYSVAIVLLCAMARVLTTIKLNLVYVSFRGDTNRGGCKFCFVLWWHSFVVPPWFVSSRTIKLNVVYVSFREGTNRGS